jgi:YfiH family protein
MIYRNKTVPFFQFKILSRDGKVEHFVSTRIGPSPQRSFNLSLQKGLNKKRGNENRQALSNSLTVPWTHITTVKQVHGNQIKVMSQSHGKQAGHRSELDEHEEADALVTDRQGLCIMILTADCVPILLYDPTQKVVGAVHAGWKGTLLNIAGKAVEVFADHFHSKPEDIMAGIGPSIGPCCFEVGPEVCQQFSKSHGSAHIIPGTNGGKEKIDLWGANATQLMDAGVLESHIEHANLCTCHHTDTFFSYRCGADKTGRFGSGIFLV